MNGRVLQRQEQKGAEVGALLSASEGCISLQPFPRYLVRYNPRAVTELDALRFEGLERLAAEVEQLRTYADTAKERLEEALFEQIGNLPKGPERYELLGARRRIHQRKELRPRELELVMSHPPVAAAWRQYRRAAVRHADFATRFGAKHCADLRQALVTMRRLAEAPVTASAVALASPTLFEALAAAREWTAAVPVSKVDESLARYVYRACAKTSPYSTFTVVSPGSLGEADWNSYGKWALRKDGPEARTVSLTGYLQEALWAHAALSPGLRLHMPCRVNGTARYDPPMVSWYTTVANLGVTRRMRAPVWLDEFTGLLGERPRATVGQATEVLATLTEVQDDKAEDIVLQLLRAGFLISDPPASALDPDWPRLTRSWFQKLARSEPEAKSLARLLAVLEEKASALCLASPGDRVRLLTTAEDVVVQVLGSTHMPTFLDPPPRPGNRGVPTVGERRKGRLSRQSLFYEDVKGPLTLDLPLAGTADLCAALNSLADHCLLLNPTVTARIALGRLVARRFGPEARVPFMQLFGEVQEHRLKAAEADENGDEYAWEYPEAREVLAEQTERAAAWSAAIAESAARAGRLNDPMRIDLRIEDLEAGESHRAGWAELPKAVSRGATVQVGRREDGSPMWVMHAPVISEGLGRMYSRFLPVLSSEFTADLREWNAALPFGDALVENVDGSRFNGNAHPWLVPAEIAVPNGNHRRAGGRGVPVAGLDVRLRNGRLELVERETDRVRVPCHLGFQTRGRNAVYELLNAFCVDGSVYMYALLEKLNARWRAVHERDEDDVAPRITFQDSLVLQRQRWRLPPRLAEGADAMESSTWFVDVNRWRRSDGIPPHVFYRVPQRKHHTQRKYRKPQYLAFSDPLGCELLRSVAAAAGTEVQLEEALPTPDRMPTGPHGCHSTEVTMCWYVQ